MNEPTDTEAAAINRREAKIFQQGYEAGKADAEKNHKSIYAYPLTDLLDEIRRRSGGMFRSDIGELVQETLKQLQTEVRSLKK